MALAWGHIHRVDDNLYIGVAMIISTCKLSASIITCTCRVYCVVNHNIHTIPEAPIDPTNGGKNGGKTAPKLPYAVNMSLAAVTA